ncbi:MAG: hypothetical protein CMD29_05270 [Flavobacteriales bacterium]|nr:hypothetical protein [Flavobacteriales bacterium]|tara:strand:+ start:2520 stop:3107 length:588 start_codon:yes stop_codon:yes gene_type:complete
MSQLLYLIRHGKALHNELFETMGVKAFRIPEGIDPPLVKEGIDQSIQLRQNWVHKDEIELILVSPLTRTLETAMNIFQELNIPIICLEFLREYPIGEDTCNKRSETNLLKNKFPKIDFSEIKLEKDELWTEKRETIEQLNDRLNQMKKYIQNRSEKKIAIVGHSSYLGQFKDNKISYQENGDEDLKHCYPYEYKL